LGADLDAVVKIDDVLVDQAHAAGRHGATDRVPLGRPVQAVSGVTALVEEIERPRAEGIAQSARLAAAPSGEFGLALDHLRRRRPGRPFALHCDARRAGPLEAFAPDADAVAHRLALGHDEIEELVLGVDDHRTRLFLGAVANDL